MENLPGWTVTEVDGLNTLRDVSRPEGWGSEDVQTENQGVVCSGITYQVDEMLSGNFEIPQTKGEVYGKCVQSIISDIIQKIENKDHKLTVTIEDAFESLKTAVLASKHIITKRKK